MAKGFKRPISRNTVQDVQQSLTEVIDYLNQLTTIDGKPLNSHRRKTFIIGFQTAAASYISVSQEVFKLLPEAKFVLAYRLNQDHLESFFSKIRLRGGWNNNPDAQQFASALKALLVKNEITPSSSANCLELEPSHSSFVKFCSKKTSPDSDNGDDIPDWCSMQFDVTELSQPIADIAEYIGK